MCQSVLCQDEQRAEFQLLPEQGVGGGHKTWRASSMRKTNHFSNATRNPYAKQLKKHDHESAWHIETIDYFKNLAGELGVPYQRLMNL